MSDFQTLIDQMEAFPERLLALIEDADDAALYYRPGAQEWSVAEVIGHLEDVDALFMGRVHQALTEDDPLFTVYEQTGPVRQRDFQRQPVGALLAIFLARRAYFVNYLRGLTDAQLNRAGGHPMHGTMTVTRIPASIPRHDQTHYDQIATNLALFRQDTLSVAQPVGLV